MKYISTYDWEQFKKALDLRGIKVVFYKIDKNRRIVEVKFIDGDVIYAYKNKPDEFPYECGILEDAPEEITKLTKAEVYRNMIFGKEIAYLIGAQKIRGFNLWCIYSDFSRTVKEELTKIFEDFILIEGDIQELD
ncbi:MAG TPA: hypothetical protein VKU94_00805 [Geobacterales bacterium]|nr:hypothetical protein [Geobacterales bacterium]